MAIHASFQNERCFIAIKSNTSVYRVPVWIVVQVTHYDKCLNYWFKFNSIYFKYAVLGAAEA